MPCEHYKDALIEAAAAGVTPQGQLRAHLENCDSCRAALAAEQSLFSSIDAALHTHANAEVPTTLLPRVRVRLNEEHSPASSWLNARLLLACAAGVILVFFVARTLWLAPSRNDPSRTATNAQSPPIPTPPQEQGLTPLPNAKKPARTPSTLVVARSSSARSSERTRTLDLEVLVPPDQEILLASYQQSLRSAKHAPLVAVAPDATILTPLDIAPIQIAKLDVKLMAEHQEQ